MEVQRFEQAILKLAFETNARITTASVAYYLGIPSREANRLLNVMLEQGVLELDSDQDGNLFYRVPASPAPKAHATTANPEVHGVSAARASASHMTLVSPDGPEGHDAPALSPRPGPGSAHHAPVYPAAPQSERASEHHGIRSSLRQGLDTPQRQAQPRTAHPQDAFGGWTSRLAPPDATLNRCGQSPVIVGTTTQCDSRPIAEARPVIISCAGAQPVARSNANSDYGLGYIHPPNQALMPAGGPDLALAREGAIDQPEHQPGMALLLSLILCGTGQIYNGEVSKGIIMMVTCFLLWFVLLGWVVHIWSIIDAVVVAERINRKTA